MSLHIFFNYLTNRNKPPGEHRPRPGRSFPTYCDLHPKLINWITFKSLHILLVLYSRISHSERIVYGGCGVWIRIKEKINKHFVKTEIIRKNYYGINLASSRAAFCLHSKRLFYCLKPHDALLAQYLLKHCDIKASLSHL